MMTEKAVWYVVLLLIRLLLIIDVIPEGRSLTIVPQPDVIERTATHWCWWYLIVDWRWNVSDIDDDWPVLLAWYWWPCWWLTAHWWYRPHSLLLCNPSSIDDVFLFIRDRYLLTFSDGVVLLLMKADSPTVIVDELRLPLFLYAMPHTTYHGGDLLRWVGGRFTLPLQRCCYVTVPFPRSPHYVTPVPLTPRYPTFPAFYTRDPTHGYHTCDFTILHTIDLTRFYALCSIYHTTRSTFIPLRSVDYPITHVGVTVRSLLLTFVPTVGDWWFFYVGGVRWVIVPYGKIYTPCLIRSRVLFEFASTVHHLVGWWRFARWRCSGRFHLLPLLTLFPTYLATRYVDTRYTLTTTVTIPSTVDVDCDLLFVDFLRHCRPKGQVMMLLLLTIQLPVIVDNLFQAVDWLLFGVVTLVAIVVVDTHYIVGRLVTSHSHLTRDYWRLNGTLTMKLSYLVVWLCCWPGYDCVTYIDLILEGVIVVIVDGGDWWESLRYLFDLMIYCGRYCELSITVHSFHSDEIWSFYWLLSIVTLFHYLTIWKLLLLSSRWHHFIWRYC